MLSKRSPGTWMSNTDRLSSAQSNTPKIYLFLCRFDHSLTFSHTMIGPLCIMPACYWSNYFSIITFSKYENRKTKTKQILVRTCLEKMACMVTLLYTYTKDTYLMVQTTHGLDFATHLSNVQVLKCTTSDS